MGVPHLFVGLVRKYPLSQFSISAIPFDTVVFGLFAGCFGGLVGFCALRLWVGWCSCDFGRYAAAQGSGFEVR